MTMMLQMMHMINICAIGMCRYHDIDVCGMGMCCCCVINMALGKNKVLGNSWVLIMFLKLCHVFIS